jgi:hypothetical protein
MKPLYVRAAFFATLYAAIMLVLQVVFMGGINLAYIVVPSIMMGLFSLFNSLLQDADDINSSIVNKHK